MEFVKKNVLIAGLIAVVVAGFVGYVLWTRSQTPPPQIQEEEQSIKQLLPSDIGLELSLRSDGKAVIIKATKLSGVKSLEYELTYDAEITEEGETNSVPRGAVGELKIKEGVAQAEVDLGTCSANVCKYDKVVGAIKVLIKVNFEDGSVGAVEDTINLEQ